MATEITLNDLDPAYVRELSPSDWYGFLLKQYFPWKYTAPNRLATTTGRLQTYFTEGSLSDLYKVKQDLFTFDRSDIRQGLTLAKGIRGLGVAGASGLLALLFSREFGTVDQFAVKALCSVHGLPEKEKLEKMKPESLTIQDGTVLVGIMRTKALELNKQMSTDYWTPRRLDMVLWTYGR